MKKIKLLTILFVCILSPLVGQYGSLSGVVLEEGITEPIIGANVVIKDLGTGTATDFDGKYQIKLEPGTYDILFSYIGFVDITVTEVQINENEITHLDMTLGEGSIEMEEVVITAEVIEKSEGALLMLQKKSDKIQNGISSQEMNRYGVGNAAGALKKVTGTSVSEGKYIYVRGLGDRYSLSQLNGLIIPSTDPYRNSAPMDLIPANLLENIITSKTYTPDQPGSFTGGNVNIKTKSLPEQFTLNVSLSSAYNTQSNMIDNFLTHTGGSADYFGFDDGYRALPDLFNNPETRDLLSKQSERLARKKGDFEAANALDQGIKSLNRQYTPTRRSVPFDHGFGISFGNQYQVFGKPVGMILSGSFKQTYRHLERVEKANWRIFDINSDALFNQGDFEDTRSTESPTINGLAGLAIKLSNTDEISFNAIYNHSAEKLSRELFGERPDNITDPLYLSGRQLSFIERELVNYQLNGTHILSGLNNAKIEWIGARSQSSQLEPQTRFFENVFNNETELNTLPASDIQLPFYFFRDLEDEQYSGKLDFTLPIGQIGHKFKIGGMFTNKDRVFTEDRFQIVTTPASGQFDGDTEAYLSDENVGIIDYDSERDRFSIGNYVVDDTNPNNSYTGSEEVFAFYGMLTYQVTPSLKFIGGARYESTDLVVKSGAENLPDSLTTGIIEATDILPSLNLIYNINPDMNLRATFSQTLARPNMREIAPFESFDPLEKFFFIGNPDLKRTNIDNLDFRWEWFQNVEDLFAVSAYYKNFTNPITQQYRNSSNPEIEFANVESGNLYGLEFEVRKSLGPIFPFMKNFKLNGNFTLIKSSLNVNDVSGFEPEERPFQGQPPYILNAALIYQDREKGWNGTITYNMIGDRMQTIGRNGTPDIYNRSRNQLDLILLKSFGDMNVKFSVENILDDDYILSSDFKGNDFIYSRFKRGVTINFGLSYTFR